MHFQPDDEEFFRAHPSADTKTREQDDHETLLPDSFSDTNEPPWKIGNRLGDFVLEKLLGKGSSGFVYRAKDELLGRRCALKLLLPTQSKNVVRNKLGFRRMIPLRHPNLIHVEQIHYLDEYIGFSMEEVRGSTLERGIWALAEASSDIAYGHLLTLIRHFASGLAVMHSQDLVHRDIKPSNLMIGSDGRGRVIDYGLVGTVNLDDDPNGYRDYLVGPPMFFAPETLWDQHYLPASDVFSLGLVLLDSLRVLDRHHLNSRVSIERSKDNRRVDREVIDQAVGEISSRVPTVLREACMEMLSSDPGDRPTAAEIARLDTSNPSLFCLPTNPMMGREKEFEASCDWVDSIFAGASGRLHIEGESGIGKSRLADEIEDYIRLKRWGQVFRAKCRSGEDHPMQAFDQICDAIANRYMKRDRTVMRLDHASVMFLIEAFPVLKDVIEVDLSSVPTHKPSKRLDAIETGVRFSEELRKMGPLFLVIDDIQWIDTDSLNVLDRLQTAGGGMLGIITISRPGGDRQMAAADQTIRLSRIDDETARDWLLGVARRWSIKLSDSLVNDFVANAHGNPFHLNDFAEEFRPGGVLYRVEEFKLTESGSLIFAGLDQLWRMRVKRLSPDAKALLPYVVTAGHLVSAEDLSELSGLGESVDAAISELVQHRLIRDEVTGNECISILHDSLIENLLQSMSEEQRKQCHSAWACLYARRDSGEKFAGRIAGHFFDAGEPGRAVSYAILAAENAERFVAKTEAARWHSSVIEYLTGNERIERIRLAAETFVEADRYHEAAEYYQLLASETTGDDSIRCEVLSASLLIRCGRFELAREKIRSLTERLGLPRPKRAFASRLCLMVSLIRLKWDTFRSKRKSQSGSKVLRQEVSSRDRQRLTLCLSLARPLSLFDNLHALELNVVGARLSVLLGDEKDRILSDVGAAVFGCYNSGSDRIQSELAFGELLPRAMETKDPKSIGDVWAGTAIAHQLMMRFRSVRDSVDRCLKSYDEVGYRLPFETSQIVWTAINADWCLGQWTHLATDVDKMVTESKQSNDFLQWLIASSGYGATNWLMADQTQELREVIQENSKKIFVGHGAQVIHFSQWLSTNFLCLYEGRFDDAWFALCEIRSRLKQPFTMQIQLMRVTMSCFAALICLHQIKSNFNDLHAQGKWLAEVRIALRALHREQNTFATTMAHFYQSQLDRLIATSPEELEEVRRQLAMVLELCKDQQLRPFQFTAEDMIAELERGTSTQNLVDQMRCHGIKEPEKFAQLYRI